MMFQRHAVQLHNVARDALFLFTCGRVSEAAQRIMDRG
jgi:hypothetical protein